MTASPIPRAAAPVVWFIRWWVKKPRTLPTAMFIDGDNCLRWPGDRCPLGAFPFSMSCAPEDPREIGMAEVEDDQSLRAFTDWWDSQTDARAAVDQVWGK